MNLETSAKLWTAFEMKTRRAIRSGRLSFAILVVALAARAVAQTPTLGEIARQEQERRKGIKSPTKVLTNEDLKHAESADVPKPAGSTGQTGSKAQADTKKDAPAPARAESSTAANASPAPALDEAGWRAKMARARDDLRRNEVFAEALQSRINALTADFAARDNPIQRAQLADERQKALADLERVRADIETSKKQIADIEEEARKAGVPPGWLR